MHTRTWEDGKYVRTFEHHFLDFVVDGRTLRELADEVDMVTPLSRPWLEDVEEEVDRLLGRRGTAELESGRVAILLCPIDGDIDCGALTARLEFTADEVHWVDWRWDSYQGSLPVKSPTESMRFDRATYEALLHGAPGRLKVMPYNELDHRGKPFLWPWEWGWRLPPAGKAQ